MKLKIRNIGTNDFGSYRCVAKNSLGETDGLIKLDGNIPKIMTILLIVIIIKNKQTIFILLTEIPAPTTLLVTEATYSNRTKGKKNYKKRKMKN